MLTAYSASAADIPALIRRAKPAVVEITAPISHGSSGSPVLDESGQVLGIATSVSKEGQNLNFAISSEAIRAGIAKNDGSWDDQPSAQTGTQTPKPAPVVVATPTPNAAESLAAYYFNRAFDEMRARNYKGAITDFTEAIRLNPGLALAYHGRGEAYEILGYHSQAAQDLKKAKEVGTQNEIKEKGNR